MSLPEVVNHLGGEGYVQKEMEVVQWSESGGAASMDTQSKRNHGKGVMLDVLHHDGQIAKGLPFFEQRQSALSWLDPCNTCRKDRL